jgi:hypothetical protein
MPHETPCFRLTALRLPQHDRAMNLTQLNLTRTTTTTAYGGSRGGCEG